MRALDESGTNVGMYVKICGLQTAETVAAAVAASADAVGFVFALGSPRTISAVQAAKLGRNVPRGIETVGVFRNQPIDEVVKTAHEAGVSTVQLHGDETLVDIARLHEEGFRTLRAFSAASYNSVGAAEKRSWESERILLDAIEPGAGMVFDAHLLADGAPKGFWLLAGGLNPANVATLAATLQPSGVDVSSGVEVTRGVKDVSLIREFIRAARSVEPATLPKNE
ncbi:phosphoribosylanthranilate isomerase [Arthrobacter sp. E3]|uniref:phosphoribosylanthranilate isomerase n=1 Tax=Arthrobacter sp. E3 TaxID=517402 RepID=UPI001FFDBAD4|nr:phosphoribosylanthranilate isomerase [Arthrobacter sp. E3]